MHEEGSSQIRTIAYKGEGGKANFGNFSASVLCR